MYVIQLFRPPPDTHSTAYIHQYIHTYVYTLIYLVRERIYHVLGGVCSIVRVLCARVVF